MHKHCLMKALSEPSAPHKKIWQLTKSNLWIDHFNCTELVVSICRCPTGDGDIEKSTVSPPTRQQWRFCCLLMTTMSSRSRRWATEERASPQKPSLSTSSVSHILSRALHPLWPSGAHPDPLGYLSRFSVNPVCVISYNSIYFNPVDYWIIGMNYFALAKR